MKNGKKLNAGMRKLISKHGFNYENYLYIKNTSTEITFIHKDGRQTITINKKTGQVDVKEEWPKEPKCINCRYCTKFVSGYYCEHPRLDEAAQKYEERHNKRINKFKPFIGIKKPKTTIRYCPYKELKRTQEGEKKK